MALLVKTLHTSGRFIVHADVKFFFRKLQTSSTLQLDQRWRAKRGLTGNPNKHGPLTNLPDYSFKDGRPTPLGIRHRTRLEKQKKYAEDIIRLTGEIDFAVERHERLQKEEIERRKAIIDSKLKPKGQLLAIK